MKFTVGHDKMGQQHIFKHHAFDHSLNLAYFKDRSKHKDKKINMTLKKSPLLNILCTYLRVLI